MDISDLDSTARSEPSPFSVPDHDVGPVDVSVIIVNYNVREFLIQALTSVESASAHLHVEVFVVDNNSVDDSVEEVRTRFPDVTLLCNRENVGFGTANNMAIRRARGRYVLILNPDTILQENTLDVLVSFMERNPLSGAAGCKILNPDGSFAQESRRAFPTAKVAFYRMIGLSRLFPRSKRFGRYNLTYLPVDETVEVDALSGSCMMIRREAFEQSADRLGDGSGLFDESFFMYGEDLDLCYRIQQAGWSIFYVPDTQIIHYKGESTKKGELRYVRLFYGAMLLFIEKHFESDRSGLLTAMLRSGIMLRAGLSYIIHQLQRAAPLLIDFLIVYLTVTLLGIARSAVVGRLLSPLFYASVSPAYALSTVLGVYWVGGYKRAGEYPIRSAMAGITLGCLVAATSGFFLPGIAFSRIVVALSLPIGASLLIAWRLRWNTKHAGPPRAILVGDEEDADRLKKMLDVHPRPPFLLSGYVGDRNPTNGTTEKKSSRLGGLSHLRDLVRLRGIREVVFAARSLSNQLIIDTMHQLRDLNVQFRMLHPGSEHVIGKSRVSPISLGSLLAQLPEVVVLRSPLSRRAFEISVAICGVAVLPAIVILSKILKSGRLPGISNSIRQFPRVISGSISLVGVRPEHLSLIPESWDLKEGVFSITNTLNTRELKDADLSQAYWYYVTHQSPGLDLDIVLRSFRMS